MVIVARDVCPPAMLFGLNVQRVILFIVSDHGGTFDWRETIQRTTRTAKNGILCLYCTIDSTIERTWVWSRSLQFRHRPERPIVYPLMGPSTLSSANK